MQNEKLKIANRFIELVEKRNTRKVTVKEVREYIGSPVKNSIIILLTNRTELNLSL